MVSRVIDFSSLQHICGMFQRGIRAIFLSFKGDLWKMYILHVYRRFLHAHQGDLRKLVKRGIFETEFYSSNQGIPWRWRKYAVCFSPMYAVVPKSATQGFDSWLTSHNNMNINAWWKYEYKMRMLLYFTSRTNVCCSKDVNSVQTFARQ